MSITIAVQHRATQNIDTPAPFPSVASLPSFPSVTSFPVIIDVDAIPARPSEPTKDNPFTQPPPRQLTRKRPLVARVFEARHTMIVTDEDIAELYETTVDGVNKAVLRNACMFPRHACFRMSSSEWHHIKNTCAIKEVDRGDWLTTPLAFTKDGVFALTTILNTFAAVRGSIIIWKTLESLDSKRRNRA